MAGSIVFFAELNPTSSSAERQKAVERILSASGFDSVIEAKDKVAVKTHIGEMSNTTHVSPDLVRLVVNRVKKLGGAPFLTETSTLYKGARSNAIDHLIHAYAHGFTYEKVGAPFIMADGLSGNSEVEVPIKGVIFDKVSIAREIAFANALIFISHPTGHVGLGLGACLKNIGMGLSSRMGKLRQHSTFKPTINAGTCTFCKVCTKWCPVEAIIEKAGKAFIVSETCIGCGECLTVCKYDAVRFDWGRDSADIQKRTAEHALGVIQGKEKKSYFLNFLIDMTKDCDCIPKKQERIIPDVGILASNDPVAVDQATMDLTRERFGKDLAKASWPNLDAGHQLEHAERIGLGSRAYSLKSV